MVILWFSLSVLLLIGMLPGRWITQRTGPFRKAVCLALGCHALSALLAAVMYFGNGFSPLTIPLMPDAGDFFSGLIAYYDGAACLMLLLVSFVGWVIGRFSIRYLDRTPNEGAYYRWTAFTVGAVSLMVVAGNLLLFFLAWVMTSFGLHHLLLFYTDRPAAQRAAWTKFAISRVGDAALIGALALIKWQFGTWDFAALFAIVQSGETTPTLATAGIGWLLVLGAMLKSAQFPFHTWLPQTLETPTPVSALMHAGIVNAGGYLVIRMSPLIVLTPQALVFLAVIGGFTACFAAVIMLTQPSIKRSLAYSTVAQMGFMMLQCGIGAFSAAMLHIVLHSLYKAHAFLASGSVLQQSAGQRLLAGKSSPRLAAAVYLALAAGVTIAWNGLFVWSLDVHLSEKPGGVLLGFILCLGLTTWLWHALRTGNLRTQIAGVGLNGMLSLAYIVGFLAVDFMVAPVASQLGNAVWWITAPFLLGFTLLFVLQYRIQRGDRPRWLNAFYIHAANGFYVEALYRRVSRQLRLAR